MADPDDLFLVKNQYWIGNYTMAIEEGNALTAFTSESLKTERDYYVYRSHLCLDEYKVVDEIKETASTPLALRAVKLYAVYRRVTKEMEKNAENEGLISQKQLVFLTLNDWLSDVNAVSDPCLILTAAEIYWMEGNYQEALSIVRRPSHMTLEQYALCVQIYLKLHSIPDAEKALKEMQKIEEDSTLTQLAQTWIWNTQGNPMKCQEGLLFYRELTERFGTSITILQSMGIASLHMKKYHEAERVLLEALNNDPTNATTLVNLIATGAYLNQDETYIEQLVGRLRDASPQHPWLEKYDQLSSGFDRIAVQFA